MAFLISFALGSLTVLSLQTNPLVSRAEPLSGNEITQVKNFIEKNNPAKFKAGEKRQLSISETEINLLSRYILSKSNGKARSKVRFFDNSLYLVASLEIPKNPIGQFINITTELQQDEDKLSIKALEIGDIAVPKFLADLILISTHRELGKHVPEYNIAINSVTSFKLRKNKAYAEYTWQPEVAKQLKNKLASAVLSDESQKRIYIYTKEVKSISDNLNTRRPSIIQLLRPIFKLASARSKNNDPIEENRAAFIVLGAYMLDKNIPEIFGDHSIGKLTRKNIYLLKRKDLSRHLLISSALTALGNSQIANTIGIEKEIKDSQGGSGFSFSDLAADRAGIVLANTALSNAYQARKTQGRLAMARFESEFMPNVNQLPDNLKNTDFKLLYSDTESSAYKNLIGIIDQRIAACDIYQ